MSRIHEALRRAEEEAHNASSISALALPAEPAAEETFVTPQDDSVVGQASTADFHAVEGPDSRCARGEWSLDAHTMVFAPGRSDHRGQEEFRTLRSRLYQIRENQRLKKLLITSALPKEGKTLVAANLAHAFACQGRGPVLLMDGDLRWPRLHVPLGAAAEPGLCEYLRGECDEYGAMQRGPVERLFFIAGGAPANHPAELLSSSRLPQLLTQVETQFDWIIIDSPPAVPVSDASVLASHCDGILLVIRAENTPVDVASRVRQEFRDNQLLGVVLNGIETTVTYSRYFYDAYRSSGVDPQNANIASSHS